MGGIPRGRRRQRVGALAVDDGRVMALPSPLSVQSPQVFSLAVPSALLPVRMSCWLGSSPRPFTAAPALGQAGLLVDAVGVAVEVVEAVGDQHALGVVPGPGADAVPGIHRRGREVGPPGLAGRRPPPRRASGRCASAPSRPPRLAPSPEPALVMKKVISASCARVAIVPAARSAAPGNQCNRDRFHCRRPPRFPRPWPAGHRGGGRRPGQPSAGRVDVHRCVISAYAASAKARAEVRQRRSRPPGPRRPARRRPQARCRGSGGGRPGRA